MPRLTIVLDEEETKTAIASYLSDKWGTDLGTLGIYFRLENDVNTVNSFRLHETVIRTKGS